MNRNQIIKLITELDEKNKKSKKENSVMVNPKFKVNMDEITKGLNMQYENYEIFKIYLKDYFKLHQKPSHIFMAIYNDAYKSIHKDKEKTMVEVFYAFEQIMQFVIGYNTSNIHYDFNRLSNKR